MRVDVVVVGAGIIGLTTALRLVEAGAKVLVVAADLSPATTSAVAAAVWYPTGMSASDRVAGWSAATFEEFARQAADGVPGVRMGRCRMVTAERETAAPWWGAAVPGLRRLTAGEAVGGWDSGWALRAPAVEMPVYLRWLADRFRNAGGILLRRHLAGLEEAAIWGPVVVCAAGLGARTLCADTAVHPVRGQLVLVTNPGLTTSIRAQDHPGGYTYIHPRSRDVVLGGTFDIDSGDLAADPATARAIRERCVGLVPELARARVVGDLVGLRPERTGGVRLEADDRILPGRRVMHNYGHGGAGVTLSWGCADAVVALAAGASAGEATARAWHAREGR